MFPKTRKTYSHKRLDYVSVLILIPFENTTILQFNPIKSKKKG